MATQRDGTKRGKEMRSKTVTLTLLLVAWNVIKGISPEDYVKRLEARLMMEQVAAQDQQCFDVEVTEAIHRLRERILELEYVPPGGRTNGVSSPSCELCKPDESENGSYRGSETERAHACGRDKNLPIGFAIRLHGKNVANQAE
jgi:hypothetical protein